ncbi:hypothetical protein STSP_35140 [Streptomyces jeddahensis]|uniref:Knr4/Smi1-like domain-containing protein n=2 Tax=Streptomyces jeddahensis TaxID=1716141 RepID=A0A177HRH8_9ACTN|nr:hypothetical protein STSP_35140 [Streptomyces jeddahensis]
MSPPSGPDSPHNSRFAALFGPPSPEAVTVPVDWDVVESWLGLRLPADYKAVVSAYGPLDIGEFIWLQAPCVWGTTRATSNLFWDTSTSETRTSGPFQAWDRNVQDE